MTEKERIEKAGGFVSGIPKKDENGEIIEEAKGMLGGILPRLDTFWDAMHLWGAASILGRPA